MLEFLKARQGVIMSMPKGGVLENTDEHWCIKHLCKNRNQCDGSPEEGPSSERQNGVRVSLSWQSFSTSGRYLLSNV